MNKPYVIALLRVSDPKQSSFEAQLETIQKHYSNYEIDEIVEIKETADDKISRLKMTEKNLLNPTREQFHEKFILPIFKRASSGQQVICLAFLADRYARNAYDAGVLDRLNKMGVHFLAPNASLVKREDAPMFFMMINMGGLELVNKSFRTKPGRIQALNSGKYIGGKVPAYNRTLKKGIKEPDPQKSIAIQEFFKDFSTGKYSLRSYLPIAKETGEKYGLRLRSLEGLRKILRQPFYAGWITYNGEIEEIKGKWFKSASPTIITMDLFKKVQQVLDGRHNKQIVNHDHLYRGRIFTTEGYLMIGSIKKKKYLYYETKQIKLKALREEKIDNFVEEYFANLPIDLANLRKKIKKTYKKERVDLEKMKKAHDLQLKKIQSQLDTLIDLRIDGEISAENFQEKKIKLERQKAEIKMKEKTGYEEKMKLLEIFVEKFTELFDFFSTSYKTLPHHLKQEILETLVRNFYYNGKKLLIEPSPLFNLLFKAENYSMVVLYRTLLELTKAEINQFSSTLRLMNPTSS